MGVFRHAWAKLAGRYVPVLSIGLCLALLLSVLGVSPAEAVAPAPSLTLMTSGGTVRDDSVIATGTEMTAAVGGLLEEGNGPRELRIDLDDATVYKAGSVVAPEGWTIEWSTDDGANWLNAEPGTASDVTSVRATATVDAGAINGSSQSYTKAVNSPVPASTFSGSTGGDGWDVFFYDNYVLNIFHHQENYVALDCHLRTSGARCTGFDPTLTSGAAYSRFSGYRAGNRSGGWVNGNTGKAYAFSAQSAAGADQGKPGALCMDLNTAPPTNCGFTPLSATANISTHNYLSNAEGVGGRLFGLESASQTLLCFDPNTNAACANSPVQLSGTNNAVRYHVVGLGTKVFATTDTTLYCFESSNLSPCAGAWPVSYSSVSWTVQNMSPVAHMDASGNIDGVCMWNGCLNLAGAVQAWTNPHSITPWSGSASNNSASGTYGKFTATAGRAYLQKVLSTNEVYCFDYATNAACAGFDTTPTADTALYALVADPNNPACIWYNSDPGKIGLFDAYTGASECSANPVITLQPSAFAPRFVCTSSGGIDRWTSLTLNTVSGGTPASQTLTVRTGNGDAVPGWTNVPVTVGNTLSLANLAVADTGARPTFNIAFSGVTGGALTSADFTILYEGRGPELCLDYLLDNTQAPGAPNCPIVQSVVGTLTQNVTGAATSQAPSRSFTVSGSNIDCPENIVYAGPPGPVQDLTVDLTQPLQGTVSWKAPSDDGGSAIRWYEVSTDGGTTWTQVTTPPDGNGVYSVVLSNLTEGSHTFDVRAVNVLGNGNDTDVTGNVTSTPTTTAAPTTTTAPTTTVTPIPDGNGNLPDLPKGGTEVTDNGAPVAVEVKVVENKTGIEITSPDGVQLTLSGDCGNACPVRTGKDGNPYLVMEDTGTVRVRGEGFMPGSTAHVWITSTNTYLGAATVLSDGTFDKSFAVNVAPGEQTVQVNGTTASGATRSANLGLLVLAGSGSGALADTGVDSNLYIYLGAALLGAGATTMGIVKLVSANSERKEEVV